MSEQTEQKLIFSKPIEQQYIKKAASILQSINPHLAGHEDQMSSLVDIDWENQAKDMLTELKKNLPKEYEKTMGIVKGFFELSDVFGEDKIQKIMGQLSMEEKKIKNSREEFKKTDIVSLMIVSAIRNISSEPDYSSISWIDWGKILGIRMTFYELNHLVLTNKTE